MHPLRITPCLLAAALALAATGAAAQANPEPASIEACRAIGIDARRLACYDEAVGRKDEAAAIADAAADQAHDRQRAASDAEATALTRAERARRQLGEFFSAEPGDEAIADAGRGSLLDSRWELARSSKLGRFNLRAYKPVYLLPAFWTNRVNDTPSSPNPANTVAAPIDIDSLEAKFQLSFKTKVVENLFGDNGDIWMGYTQSSHWQVYSAQQSRPFRETDYEPEAMLVLRTNYGLLGWKGRMAGVGIVHQSNGRADPLSRSWNRVVFNIGLDRENWAVSIRPWVRIKESRGSDNNPDIQDYVGRGDVTIVHAAGDHQLSLMARHSLRAGDRSHGALQFDWAFPIDRNLRGHLQVFDGYGESLIDYNHRALYFGLGVSLLEWY